MQYCSNKSEEYEDKNDMIENHILDHGTVSHETIEKLTNDIVA